MGILLKSVVCNGQTVDIYIEGNIINRIVPEEKGTDSERSEREMQMMFEPDTVIDCQHKAVIPGFVNMHTHAAMTLFRGFGDDVPLMAWLEEKIWPNEAKLTHDDIYWGAKLACVEMLRSGTTTFFDMYHQLDATAEAVEAMGLRAVLSEACFDHFDPIQTKRCKQSITHRFNSPSPYSQRIRFALGPHAIYTVSGTFIRWISDFANDHDSFIHLHLAETESEVAFCRERYGTTPVRYLHQLGVLSPRLILAHALYVDDEELRMLADFDVKVVHNPASNMKLASGYRFMYQEMREAGIQVALGTDGCSSSNNLDMIEVMKLASLLGKVWRNNPEAMSCDDMLYSATVAGSRMIGLNAGRIAEGCLADLCLIDLHLPAFTPNFNFVSNLVFAANGSCVDTVICDGRIVMRDKKVSGEEEIMEQAARAAYNLCGSTS